jgi:Xaa-Pro aminopeptidase
MTDQNKENESKELMHEAYEAIERLRAACPLGDVRTPMHIAQHFIDHTAWLDENLERAKKRNNLLYTEQDQLREALGIDVTVDLVDEVRRLKQDTRIKEMDEALETALMETTKQAQVIDELRDKLGRAENSIDDLLYDAANLKGQKEALERAIEIIGGRQ